MTKILTSAALVALLAGPVMAQTATDAPATPAPAETMAPDAANPPAASPDAAPEMPAATEAAATTAGFGYAGTAGDMSGETFIGKRLYVSETDIDASADMTEVNKDWDDVGEISDLVIGQDGMVKAVLVDIGGFLGMGEKSVAVAMDQLDVIRDGDSENDYFIVFKADRAALESAPAFEWPKM